MTLASETSWTRGDSSFATCRTISKVKVAAVFPTVPAPGSGGPHDGEQVGLVGVGQQPHDG